MYVYDQTFFTWSLKYILKLNKLNRTSSIQWELVSNIITGINRLKAYRDAGPHVGPGFPLILRFLQMLARWLVGKLCPQQWQLAAICKGCSAGFQGQMDSMWGWHASSKFAVCTSASQGPCHTCNGRLGVDDIQGRYVNGKFVTCTSTSCAACPTYRGRWGMDGTQVWCVRGEFTTALHTTHARDWILDMMISQWYHHVRRCHSLL